MPELQTAPIVQMRHLIAFCLPFLSAIWPFLSLISTSWSVEAAWSLCRISLSLRAFPAMRRTDLLPWGLWLAAQSQWLRWNQSWTTSSSRSLRSPNGQLWSYFPSGWRKRCWMTQGCRWWRCSQLFYWRCHSTLASQCVYRMLVSMV